MAEISPEDILATKPDCLSGAAVEQKAETVAIGKTKLKPFPTFMLAIMAGMMIGLGGIFMTYVKSDHSLSFATSSVLGGFVFSLGLVCVVIAGAELFTGNCLMITACNSKKITWGATLKNWVIVWVGNLVGSLVLVAVVAGCSIWAVSAGDNTVGDQMVAIASAKTSLSPLEMFCRGIMCNFLVCLAVWMGFCGRTVIDKFFTCVFPVMAFVAMGYEHCVANMFLLPMGFFAQSAGFGAGTVALAGIATNIGIVTLGNIVGGSIFVGLIYWLAYAKRDKAAK